MKRDTQKNGFDCGPVLRVRLGIGQIEAFHESGYHVYTPLGPHQCPRANRQEFRWWSKFLNCSPLLQILPNKSRARNATLLAIQNKLQSKNYSLFFEKHLFLFVNSTIKSASIKCIMARAIANNNEKFIVENICYKDFCGFRLIFCPMMISTAHCTLFVFNRRTNSLFMLDPDPDGSYLSTLSLAQAMNKNLNDFCRCKVPVLGVDPGTYFKEHNRANWGLTICGYKLDQTGFYPEFLSTTCMNNQIPHTMMPNPVGSDISLHLRKVLLQTWIQPNRIFEKPKIDGIRNILLPSDTQRMVQYTSGENIFAIHILTHNKPIQ